MDQGNHETDVGKCGLCGAKLWPDAVFCVNCGNAVDVEIKESDWCVPSNRTRPHVPLSVWQKIVWLIVCAFVAFGVYVMRGGKIAASVSTSGPSQSASSADVLAAEKRLEDIRKSIDEENARRDRESKMAKDRFRRSQDEVRKLREELDGVK